ncbi:carbon-monoxide dehydrogenase large subunit [Bradyrhizobium sp. USDA 4011]
MGLDGIGASVVRKEGKRFITGRGRFVDDIKLPGMTYAHFIRSPHAHGKVKNIDASAALGMPGVVAVLNGKQIVDDKVGNLICDWAITFKDGSPMKMDAWPAMAPETVRFVGQAIAVVIAESKNLARDAAEAVVVDYEELAAVADVHAAIKAGAPQLHPEAPGNQVYDWVIGGETAVNGAFAKAVNVVKMDVTNNRLASNPMEPRSAIADYDAAEEHYTLYTTSQNPHVARLVLSAFYNIAPEHKLRVIAPDVGGGFGSKIYIYPEEMVALWASKKVGRPVKWTGDRTEAFLTDPHGRDHVTQAETAFDKDNKIRGLRVKTHANFGAYMSLFSSAVPTYLYATLLSGQYVIPAIYAEVIGVYTNTTPVDAYRGAGRPEASDLLERMMETAARQLKVDPAELRKKNFITTFPYQTPVIIAYDVGDFNASIDAAMKALDYAGFAGRKAKAKSEGKLRGIGVSCYIEAGGITPSKAVGSLGAGVGLRESAEIRVNPVGTIEVLTGSHSYGQGHETTFCQLVADRLGVPISQVSIVHGDTDKVQSGMGTYGSRSAAVGLKAMEKMEAKAKKIAAHVRRPTSSSKTASSRSPAPTSRSRCRWSRSPPIPRTILRGGRRLRPPHQPMVVEGQVHGGLAQGIGQALLEQAVESPKSRRITDRSRNQHLCVRRSQGGNQKAGSVKADPILAVNDRSERHPRKQHHTP